MGEMGEGKAALNRDFSCGVLSASMEYCVCGYRLERREVGVREGLRVMGLGSFRESLGLVNKETFIQILVSGLYLDLGFPNAGPIHLNQGFIKAENTVTWFCLENRNSS